jgi:hypothetical protein
VAASSIIRVMAASCGSFLTASPFDHSGDDGEDIEMLAMPPVSWPTFHFLGLRIGPRPRSVSVGRDEPLNTSRCRRASSVTLNSTLISFPVAE